MKERVKISVYNYIQLISICVLTQRDRLFVAFFLVLCYIWLAHTSEAPRHHISEP